MKILQNFTSVLAVSVMFLAGTLYYTKALSDEAHVEKLEIVSKGNVKHTFEVEIAATPVDREVGLMFRTHMEPDHGMLFEMEKTEVTGFWMKNTLIPLDMLFIAPDGTIKTIRENAVPKSLDAVSSDVPVNAVLELNGGRARALGITAGDKVSHSFFAGPLKK